VFHSVFLHHVNVGKIERVGADHCVFEVALVEESDLNLRALYFGNTLL
jgi:hypothetical protein